MRDVRATSDWGRTTVEGSNGNGAKPKSKNAYDLALNAYSPPPQLASRVAVPGSCGDPHGFLENENVLQENAETKCAAWPGNG
jgi:hypothetical protein